jgi:hypothetical protein
LCVKLSRVIISVKSVCHYSSYLTTNSVHVAELREVYNDDVEQLDFLVGSLAESPLPSVFGFSDTFFRIFVLMARRRIMADRFYTDDYTAEFYTQWGEKTNQANSSIFLCFNINQKISLKIESWSI